MVGLRSPRDLVPPYGRFRRCVKKPPMLGQYGSNLFLACSGLSVAFKSHDERLVIPHPSTFIPQSPLPDRMSPPTTTIGPFRCSPAAAGALFCLVAIIGYSTANACMRKLSESCPSSWAICNKELVTVLAVGPWLAWQIARRKIGFPTGRPLMALIAVGLATELIGNIGTQWGYSIVGLAVMIPATTGFLLVATAVLGAVLLRERVSARNAAALALLIVALMVLGYGISQASTERQNGSPATAETGVAILCRFRGRSPPPSAWPAFAGPCMPCWR